MWPEAGALATSLSWFRFGPAFGGGLREAAFSGQEAEERLDIGVGADIPVLIDVGAAAGVAAVAGQARKEGFNVGVGAGIAVVVEVHRAVAARAWLDADGPCSCDVGFATVGHDAVVEARVAHLGAGDAQVGRVNTGDVTGLVGHGLAVFAPLVGERAWAAGGGVEVDG